MSLIKEQTKKFQRLLLQDVIDRIGDGNDWQDIVNWATKGLGKTELNAEQRQKIDQELQLMILKSLDTIMTTKFH